MSVNKLILKQLEKLNEAQIVKYDESKNCYLIKKKESQQFKLNSCYIVELHNSLLLQGNYVSCNWNNGKVPKYSCMKIDVSKKLGDMIYVTGLYYNKETHQDINEMFEGWLP